MHNSSGISLPKALDTTLSKAKVSGKHNNSGIAPLVGIKGHFEQGWGQSNA